MEAIYSVCKKSAVASNREINENNNKINNNNRALCTISTGNVIAFTTTVEVTDNSLNSWGFYVYIADINMPWLSYKVTSNKYPITVLEWDLLGKYLLVADVAGNVQIWSQKDNLISEWIQLYSITFAGEQIIRAVFFNNGRKIALATDKKDVTNYLEKFQRYKFAPSVRQFGGVPALGVLIVTSTGMLGTFLIPTENTSGASTMTGNSLQSGSQHLTINIIPVTESLGHVRSYITVADITYAKNGQFLLAVTNSSCKSNTSIMVNCYRVNVKKVKDKLTITSQAWPSFFICEGAGRDINDLKISHLKWVSTDDSDSLLVGCTCSSGSFLEMWGMVEKSTPIHKLFQTPNKTEVFKTVVWNHQVNYRHTSTIIGICPSKFHYGNSSYIFVAMSDSTIHCLHRDSLKRGLPNAPLTTLWRKDNDQHIAKHARLDLPVPIEIVAHDISWMGHVLITFDTHGQMFAYKIQLPHQEQLSTQMNNSYLVSLLEYCLVAGYDALDIFLTIKPHQIDSIVDKLNENFTRQLSSIQQYYYVNYLTMKTNLFRLSITGQTKAHDLTSLLMLHSILIAFKSLLRPSDLTSHDKGPAENLAMVLSESVPDIDKVLLGLEAKDFTVEPSTLQSLQQLIQWVADLALNILARLPENRLAVGASRNTGYDISKDIVALNSIRELLVMMRIWGLLKPQCLPVFWRSAENLDVLATLFRLLTRLALNPNEPDEQLLDECCLLPSQVLIPQLQFITSQTSIASPLLAYASLPVHLEYNVEPASLKFSPDIPTVEGGLSSDNMVDSIRHLQLGKCPSSLRRCTRCGACSSLWSVARTAAMRAWEQRWASSCRCGGYWRLQTLT